MIGQFIDSDATWSVLEPVIGQFIDYDVTRFVLEPVIGPIPKSMSTSAIPDRRVSECCSMTLTLT